MVTAMPDVTNWMVFLSDLTFAMPDFGVITTACELSSKFSPFGIKLVSMILSEYDLKMYFPSEVMISSELFPFLKFSNFLFAF
jgi:hypothetical protein